MIIKSSDRDKYADTLRYAVIRKDYGNQYILPIGKCNGVEYCMSAYWTEAGIPPRMTLMFGIREVSGVEAKEIPLSGEVPRISVIEDSDTIRDIKIKIMIADDYYRKIKEKDKKGDE